MAMLRAIVVVRASLLVLALLHVADALAQDDINAYDFALETSLHDAMALANKGNPAGQWLMGVRYERGADVEQDFEQAFYWYRQSAEQGISLAQRFLANLYGRDDHGFPQDLRKSMIWSLKAAKQGDSVSQLMAAIGYANGEGVLLDEREAVRWFRKAAMQGLAIAQHQLAIKYITGHGTPEDFVTGYAWMNLAAAQGIEHAKKSRETMRESLLTREQLTEAHQLSRDLQRQIESGLTEGQKR